MDIFGFDTDKQWDYENGFYLICPSERLAKPIAQYELYKSIINLPGEILEFGVYKGASFMRLAAFRDLIENPYSRKLIGFDIFGEFPVPDGESDSKFVEKFVSEAGDGISVGEMRAALDRKGVKNYELIPGDIVETLPDYVESHQELRIALLHIDVDVFEASEVILEQLFDRVVEGGVIVLDDYAKVEGETRAVDDFIKGKGLKIEKSPIYHVPSFIRL